MKFHHIGVACADIEKTGAFVETVFNVTGKTGVIFDEKQNAYVSILELADGTRIELISGEVVNSFLKKRQFLYQTCWEVKSIDEAIENFVNNGAMLISPPKEAILFNNRRIAFLFTDLGIIELLEE